MYLKEYVDQTNWPNDIENLSHDELIKITLKAEAELNYVNNQINRYRRFSSLFPHLKLVSAETFEMDLRRKELERFLRKSSQILRGNMNKAVGESFNLSDPNAGAMDSRDWLTRQSGSAEKRRNVNKHLSHGARVSFGTQMEKKMIDALKKLGINMEPAAVNQDMFDKVDAFWTTDQGVKLPVQFKYRDSGDDILLELIKNWTPAVFQKDQLVDTDFTGRDMVGKSKVYACLNRKGDVIRIRTTKEAKEIAKKMVQRLANEFKLMGNRSVKTQYGEVKITRDPASGKEKVMAYINPSVFTFSKDLNLKNSLWT